MNTTGCGKPCDSGIGHIAGRGTCEDQDPNSLGRRRPDRPTAEKSFRAAGLTNLNAGPREPRHAPLPLDQTYLSLEKGAFRAVGELRIQAAKCPVLNNSRFFSTHGGCVTPETQSDSSLQDLSYEKGQGVSDAVPGRCTLLSVGGIRCDHWTCRSALPELHLQS